MIIINNNWDWDWDWDWVSFKAGQIITKPTFIISIYMKATYLYGNDFFTLLFTNCILYFVLFMQLLN